MNLVIKKTCLRFAVNPSQGQGWSEYTGTAWVNPKNYSVVRITDNRQIPRLICEDRNDNKIWELATYDRNVNNKSSPVDKEIAGAGTEIAWRKWCKEIVAINNKQQDKIELLESHFYLRPKQENQGKTGYTDVGYRNNLQIDYDIYKDGDLLDVYDTVEEVPENGDVVFSGNKVEGRRILPVIKGTAGELEMVGRDHDLIAKPKQGSRTERVTNKDTYESEFSSLALWLTRGENLLLNRISGLIIAGTVTGTTGPDGRSNSGMILSANLNLGNALYAGDYTVILWIKTGVTIPLLPALTQYGNTYNSWKLMCVENTNLPANIVITVGSIYDIRIKHGHFAVIADALEDYYNSIVNREGNQYLPRF